MRAKALIVAVFSLLGPLLSAVIPPGSRLFNDLGVGTKDLKAIARGRYSLGPGEGRDPFTRAADR